MSREEMRIVVCEWIGWTDVHICAHEGELCGIYPGNQAEYIKRLLRLPTLDMNLIHEAELVLYAKCRANTTEDPEGDFTPMNAYSEALEKLDPGGYGTILATPEQRAEALLKAIGK